MHTTNNTIQASNKLMKQEVKPDGIQCYNIHQESVLLDLITESDIYNNYIYTSFTDWEIEKTPEANPKKLEFNIDKPKRDLKKIDSNIKVNDDKIDNMNNKEVVHLSGELTNDDYNNIEDHEIQHERINRNNSVYTLDIDKLQSSPQLEDQNDTNDWKNTNKHEGGLVMAYDNNTRSNTLYSMHYILDQTIMVLVI